MVKTHTSDMVKTHTSDIPVNKDGIRLYTSDIRMTYEHIQVTYE